MSLGSAKLAVSQKLPMLKHGSFTFPNLKKETDLAWGPWGCEQSQAKRTRLTVLVTGLLQSVGMSKSFFRLTWLGHCHSQCHSAHDHTDTNSVQRSNIDKLDHQCYSCWRVLFLQGLSSVGWCCWQLLGREEWLCSAAIIWGCNSVTSVESGKHRSLLWSIVHYVFRWYILQSI